MPTNSDREMLIKWLSQLDEDQLIRVKELKERMEKLEKPFFKPDAGCKMSRRSVSVHSVEGEPVVVYTQIRSELSVWNPESDVIKIQ